MVFQSIDHYRVISSIDSIQLLNGEYRKRWNMTNEAMQDHWAEGIGSLVWYGIFNPLVSDIALCGDNYGFACFHQDYQTLYLTNPNCESCFCTVIPAVPEIQGDSPDLKIYPNPAFREIVVGLPDGGKACSLRITTIEGKTVLTLSGLPEKLVTVPVKGLAPGEYLLTVFDCGSHPLRTGKLLIK